MPAPAAPTITVTPSTANGRISIAFNNGASTVDYNNLYRDGVKISELIADDGTFTDYGAVHGVVHTYQGEAVAGSDRVLGASKNGQLTLASAWVSAVTKYSATSNALYSVALADLIPQQQQYGFATQTYPVGGAVLPAVGRGVIESGQVSFTARVRAADLADFTTLEQIFRSSSYLCLRDVKGNKWFGRLPGYLQAYNHGFHDFPFTLEVFTFDESVD